MFRAVLRTPGISSLLVASIVGRLPMGALGLVLLLRTREMTGSYAAGGVVAAASALAHAAGAPVLGRMVDRRGQTGVLAVSAAIWAAGMAAFAALPDGAPLAAAIAAALVTGATFPPLISCQRAIWADRLDGSARDGAFTLESVIFELVYIAGPLLVVGGVGAWSLQAAAASLAVFGFVGAIAFAAHSLSRSWRPAPVRSENRWGPLHGAGVRTLLLALALFAVGVAGVEVAVAAFAEREGDARSVAVLLALWGAGSMAGGLLSGRLPAPRDRARRLVALYAALALLNLPLALAESLVAMGALITLAGVAIAPALAATFSLLSDVAPEGTVTEAQAWVGTAFGTGIAAGSALAGWVVETSGTTLEFVLVAAGIAAAAGALAARRDTLRPARSRVRPQPRPEPAAA